MLRRVCRPFLRAKGVGDVGVVGDIDDVVAFLTGSSGDKELRTLSIKLVTLLSKSSTEP